MNGKDPTRHVNVKVGGAHDNGTKDKSNISIFEKFFKAFFQIVQKSPNNIGAIGGNFKDTAPQMKPNCNSNCAMPSKLASKIIDIKKKLPDEPINIFGHSRVEMERYH